MIMNKYNAYDIILGTDSERYIAFYDVTLEKNDECGDFYRKTPINCVHSTDLVEDIKILRDHGYYSLAEFGFLSEQLECVNPLATMFLTINGLKVKPLEKTYIPENKFGLNYLVGAVNYINLVNGKETFLKTINFGLESEELIAELGSNGYVNIADTRFKEKTSKRVRLKK